MGTRLNINQSNPRDNMDALVFAKSNIFLTPPPLSALCKLHVCQLLLLHICELGKMRLLTEKVTDLSYFIHTTPLLKGKSSWSQCTAHCFPIRSARNSALVLTERRRIGDNKRGGWQAAARLFIARLPTPIIIILNIYDL